MELILSLLMRTGLGKEAAALLAKGALLVAVLLGLWACYHFVWAAPRQALVEAQQTIGGLEETIRLGAVELGQLKQQGAQWQAAAANCSTATATAAAQGRARSTAAGAAASSAALEHDRRMAALRPGSGPDAMNLFMKEVYR